MKTISTELASHLAGEVTTLATCWKLTRRDGTVMGFTDHDADLLTGGVWYYAASGFSPAKVDSQSDMKAGSVTLEGVLSSDAISEADILAGRYDFAEVEIFTVNYADLSQGALNLRTGWIGEVKKGRERFEAEMTGLAARLDRTLGDLYSPTCRAQFGDTRCGVDKGTLTEVRSITAVTSRREFTDTALAAGDSGYFDYGQLTFTSGANDGLSMEVKHFTTGGHIELTLPMPFEVVVGDAYTMHPGCDKSFTTCAGRYNNAVNFRGEPHVPGTDKMLETSSTRS